MNLNDDVSLQDFQRCLNCGRWMPKEYLDNEKRHECPENKNMWISRRYKDGKHEYE